MKNKKKLFRIISIVFIAMGIIFILVGLIKLAFIDSNMKNEKGSNNDFEILSYQYNEKNKVSILMFSGFFMSVGIGTTFFILSNKHDVFDEESNSNVNSNNCEEGSDSTDNNKKSNHFDVSIDNKKKCIHCGAPIETGKMKKCDYCGCDI